MGNARMIGSAVLALLALCTSAWANSPPPSDATQGFALYLLADGSINGTQAARMDLSELKLRASPLFTDADIVDYDWNDHSFELKRGVSVTFPNPGVNGVPFVVVARGQRVYMGAFWTSLSSVSFPNPVIDFFGDRKNQRYRIDRAYPTAAYAPTRQDPRADGLIRDVLVCAGKLNSHTGQTDPIAFRDRDLIVRIMKRESDAVVHVAVKHVTTAGQDKAGIWFATATCRVADTIKGDAREGAEIRVNVSWYDSEQVRAGSLVVARPCPVREGEEYVLFLSEGKGQGTTPTYTPVDWWVGAQPYSRDLVTRLKRDIK